LSVTEEIKEEPATREEDAARIDSEIGERLSNRELLEENHELLRSGNLVLEPDNSRASRDAGTMINKAKVEPTEVPTLVEDFDENFVDREAEPVEEGTGEFCDVCYLEYAATDFFALKCGHRFCVNCQAGHLKTKITNGMANKLPCMELGCKEKYKVDEI